MSDRLIPLPGNGGPGDLLATDKTSPGKRKRPRKAGHWSRRRKIMIGLIGTLALALIAYGGFYAYILYKAENDITHSNVLNGVDKPHGQGMDLLLMGLDTRLDEKGRPLSKEIYDALHAGTANDGGNNSNVLMYVHVSDDGSRAFAISIPRDDYVEIADCTTDTRLRQYVPTGCKAKVKEAYNFAFAAAQDEGKSWQESKDYARTIQIKTVEQFLGIKISSFVEVTMVAFFEIAKQIGKVQVCVKNPTTDTYSGANFRAGLQWIDAQQAVAFVRQRRDLHERYSFTDLDRSRRQQAFIVSLLTQLKSAGTLLNPFKVNGIIDVAAENVVLSKGLDPISLSKIASNLSGGNLHFYTLPIVGFDKSPKGDDINVVDLAAIRTIVGNLLNPPEPKSGSSPKAPSKAPLVPATGYTVNTVNSSGAEKAASKQLSELQALGYTAGTATNGELAPNWAIRYNPTDKAAAESLSTRLGGDITLLADPSSPQKTLTVILGTQTIAGATSPSASASSSATPSDVPTVSATAGGSDGPSTNSLSDLKGSGIPCVK